jgi:hypothetical protein
VQFDQSLRDGQADAEPALRAIERLIALHEEVEDVRQDLRVDAGAFVTDADPHDAVNQGGSYVNACAFGRELGGVRQ